MEVRWATSIPVPEYQMLTMSADCEQGSGCGGAGSTDPEHREPLLAKVLSAKRV